MAENEASCTGQISAILSRAGLPALTDNFLKEKIEPNIICSMTDEDLTRLGITTIGERIRLRESAKLEISNTNNPTTRMFPGFRNLCRQKVNQRVGKKDKSGSWTAQFFCVSSIDQERTPSCTEKEVLHKTGLGLKKVKVLNTFNEEEVIDLLKSDDVFPKLKQSGGFELLRTMQNGRNLVSIPSPWTSHDLKIIVGPQARIYIRPIQHTLSIEPIVAPIKEPSVKITCEKCHVAVVIQQLRDHVKHCSQPLELPEISSYITVANAQDIPKDNEVEGHYYDYVFTDYSESFQDPVISQNSHESTFQNVLDVQNVDNSQEIPFDNLLESHSHVTHSIMQESDALNSIALHSQTHVLGKVDEQIKDTVNGCISFCKQKNISNPVEVLRKIQQEIVVGRQLEVEDAASSIEGETTFISVDRDNILITGMEEISVLSTEELRKTLEVQFYKEQACDYGGPRKEFFRLILIELKEKYFDNGLRDLLAADYKTVGIIFALTILQNGKLPTFLSPEVVAEIFNTEEPQSLAVRKLREGFNVLGMHDLFMGLPELKFLLQPSSIGITMKRVVTLLKACFSEEGSNAIQFENKVYGLFIKYMREVTAGRRGNITLSSILQFVTSTDEEPVLGFKIPPSIQFCEVIGGFLPTSSTCVNSLTIPRPTQNKRLPEAETLFNLYDFAFSNTFYGLH